MVNVGQFILNHQSEIGRVGDPALAREYVEEGEDLRTSSETSTVSLITKESVGEDFKLT